jgi:uncharacterized protein
MRADRIAPRRERRRHRSARDNQKDVTTLLGGSEAEVVPLAELDRNGFEVLTRPECMRLLGTVYVGRVGVSVDALPVILPVNFALDGHAVVFRTTPGTKLDAAVAGNVVCFEADDVDAHAGWSVLITGRAAVVTGDTSRLDQLVARPWPANSHWVRIPGDVVSGRRLVKP